jgi:hypothetical protein
MGLWKWLTDNQGNARPKILSTEADAIIRLVIRKSEGGNGGAAHLAGAWWDGGLLPVGGPNPNGLRQRVVSGPTPGGAGVYLKTEPTGPNTRLTKIGSADDFAERYGRNATNPIEVEIPQTRMGPAADDSAYTWTAKRQLRFDEEYVDRLVPWGVKYRDPGPYPKAPVDQAKWEKYRHIFGYGDLPSNFGYHGTPKKPLFGPLE